MLVLPDVVVDVLLLVRFFAVVFRFLLEDLDEARDSLIETTFEEAAAGFLREALFLVFLEREIDLRSEISS